MVKNFMFYAFSTFVNDWVERAGAGRLFQTWGIVACALIATSIPMCALPFLLHLSVGSIEMMQRLFINTPVADIFGKANRKFMSSFYSKHKILKNLV